MSVQRRYGTGDLSSAELEAELREFFATAADDPATKTDAAEAGIPLDLLLAGGPEQIEVTGEDPQLTGLEIAIVVLLLQPPVQSGWDKVILPWLKRRNAKAVGDPEDKEQ